MASLYVMLDPLSSRHVVWCWGDGQSTNEHVRGPANHRQTRTRRGVHGLDVRTRHPCNPHTHPRIPLKVPSCDELHGHHDDGCCGDRLGGGSAQLPTVAGHDDGIKRSRGRHAVDHRYDSHLDAWQGNWIDLTFLCALSVQ